MQLAIDLPDELGQELLKHGDVQNFIQQAIKKMLMEERQQSQAKNEIFLLMDKIPDSVSLADELIQERRHEAKQQDNHQ